MSFFLARTFDHAAYYETRLLLSLAMLALALWRLKGGDRRFLVAFLSGLVFQGLMEWSLAVAGVRGAGYTMGLFGQSFAGLPTYLLQGLLEGAPLTVLAFWFADLAFRRARGRAWRAYGVALGLVLVLAVVVSVLAQGQPPTSVRPMFRNDPLGLTVLAAAVVLVLVKARLRGLALLGLFGLGIVVYLAATYTPMQAAGVRYIAVGSRQAPAPAGLFDQVWVMALSHVWEVAAGKLHYFAAPFALGLLDIPARSRQPAVVFLHGWLMGPDIWSAARAWLEPRVRCLAPWQPAHGPEPGPDRPWAMRDWTRWLFRRLDAEGADRVVLVGHSMGGMLALAAALERPERVVGLVLVGTSAAEWPEPARKEWLTLVDTVAADLTPALAAQLGAALVGPDFLHAHPQWTADWRKAVRDYDLPRMANLAAAVAGRPDPAGRLGELKAPVLVVHGEADAAIPVDEAQRTAGAVSGAELFVQANVGHCPPLEAPEAFAERLQQFLQGLASHVR